MRETEVAQIMALADEWAVVSADGALNGDERLWKKSPTRAALETRIREALSEQAGDLTAAYMAGLERGKGLARGASLPAAPSGAEKEPT